MTDPTPMSHTFTDTFTHKCPDCRKTVHVVGGRERRHWCRMPRHLRGTIGAAWADGERWVMEHPDQYGLTKGNP